MRRSYLRGFDGFQLRDVVNPVTAEGSSAWSACTVSRTQEAASIELRVDAPQQLFHELDPSPLADRGLDEAVERYIIESARELPARSYELLLHVPGDLPPERMAALAKSIRAYFAYRRDMQTIKLRRLLAEGRRTLAIGLAFLFVCGLLGVLATETLPAPIGPFLNQGLLIIGWVANWRPVEIFLHGWQPIRRQRNLLGRLAEMDVQFLQP